MAFDHKNIINAFIRVMEERPSLFSGHYEALNEQFSALPADERQFSDAIKKWCFEHPEIADAHLEILTASPDSGIPDSRGIGKSSRKPDKDKEQEGRDPVIRLLNILRRSSPPRDSKTGRTGE